MLSSVKLGVRPRTSVIFSNSSGSNPSSFAVATVVSVSVEELGMRLIFGRYLPAHIVSAGGCKITQKRAMKFMNYQQKDQCFSLSVPIKDETGTNAHLLL